MLFYGAAYYPEQESPETIREDLRLMQEIGFNAIRVGEFAWVKMEPALGQYQWQWLDDVVNRFGEQGIKTLLCTPTANPPRWMIEQNPEILYVDHRGVIRPFGCRRHYCYNAPAYREHCANIASALAKRYGASPHVMGFHIDNELAQEATGRCHCKTCAQKFRAWLEQKYQTLGNFNKTIGATFWSQEYDSFQQVDPPLRTIEESADPQLIENFMDNPTLRLDWERFCSESIIQFVNVQRDQIRASAKQPITTNGTGIGTNGVNYYDLFGGLDVIAGDVYPSVRTDSMFGTTTDYAFHRGVKSGKPFWVAETSAGGGGQGVWSREGGLQPFPGTLHQNAIQAFACGAELVTYFQWRTFPRGAEQLENSIIDIDGIPRRRFKEFQAAAAEIKALAPLLADSQIRNEVAICYDYDAYWGIRIKPFKKGYDYRNQVHAIATPLAQRGIGCDVIPAAAAINGYKIVFIPTPLVMSAAFKQILRNFVRNGGVVVTNFLAALKDEFNNGVRGEQPAGLTDLFGLRVGEGEIVFDEPSRSSVSQISASLNGKNISAPNQWWTEVLEARGAQVIARYDDTFRKGEPVMGVNHFGKGRAYYLGTWLFGDAMGDLLHAIVTENGVLPHPIKCGPGVEVIRRVHKDGSAIYFVFNYRQADSFAEFQAPFADFRSDRKFTGRMNLSAKEFLLLREC
jgi:beta-galactosidase